MSIENIFYNNIVNKCQVKEGDRILLGISGGPDSLCLLDLLSRYQEKLGVGLGVAHIHHGLRGKDSDKDALFVKEVALKYEVPFYELREDVGKIARDNGWSLEEAGRKVRYDFFKKVMEEEGYNLVAVGHHEKDQCETVLLHLIRGSGIKGLSGMKFKNENCIRPLLSIPREEIMSYIKEENIPYCVDATNEEASFLRNKVRLHLIPELLKYNKGIVKHLFNLSQIADEENTYIEKKVTLLKGKYVKMEERRVFFDWKLLEEDDILRKRLYQLVYYEMSGKSLYYDYVNKTDAYLYDRKEKNQLGLPGNVVVKKTAKYFSLALGDKKEAEPYEFYIEGEGDYLLPDGGTLIIRELTVVDDYIKSVPKEGFLSMNGIKGPLKVRSRRPGDTYIPFGRGSEVKVKDLYIKKKVDRACRDIFPVVVNGDGEILFIPVLGINNRFRIKEKGEKVLYIYYEEINCHS